MQFSWKQVRAPTSSLLERETPHAVLAQQGLREVVSHYCCQLHANCQSAEWYLT
jgi:hypothetical protein